MRWVSNNYQYPDLLIILFVDLHVLFFLEYTILNLLRLGLIILPRLSLSVSEVWGRSHSPSLPALTILKFIYIYFSFFFRPSFLGQPKTIRPTASQRRDYRDLRQSPLKQKERVRVGHIHKDSWSFAQIKFRHVRSYLWSLCTSLCESPFKTTSLLVSRYKFTSH